jgi:hypothetical protein
VLLFNPTNEMQTVVLRFVLENGHRVQTERQVAGWRRESVAVSTVAGVTGPFAMTATWPVLGMTSVLTWRQQGGNLVEPFASPAWATCGGM